MTIIEEHNEPDEILRWDRDAREVITEDAEGEEISRRPYTDEENAAEDNALVIESNERNRLSIEEALENALVEIQTIIDTPNATINSSPAAHIKTLARAQRRMIRLLTRRLDGSS